MERENDDDCSMTRLDPEIFEFEHFKLNFNYCIFLGRGQVEVEPDSFQVESSELFQLCAVIRDLAQPCRVCVETQLDGVGRSPLSMD